MGIISQLILGNAIRNLTTLFEELEATKITMYIGAGGGLDSLPIRRQKELETKLPKWLATLRSHPRHLITKELIKNMHVCQKFNHPTRLSAQGKLLEMLISEKIALGLDEFLESYQD